MNAHTMSDAHADGRHGTPANRDQHFATYCPDCRAEAARPARRFDAYGWQVCATCGGVGLASCICPA